MSNIKNKIYEILKPLNIPIKHLSFSGKADTYIVYRRMNRDRDNYSDDEPETKSQLWQIDIFSMDPIEDELIDKVDGLMESNGFEWDDETGPDIFPASGENWVAIRFNFYEEEER